MFSDLDNTLSQILDDAAAPAELRAADVNFLMPDKDFTPSQATVNLYLYEVSENRELRTAEPIIERVGTQYVRRQPPLRVACNYMVTTWSTETGAVKVAEEHRLLSQALLWLSRFPTIPDLYLQGSLVNPPYPLPTMVAQMNGGKSVGEFWAALGQPPRPSFNVLVTVAMDLNRQIEGDLVTTKITEFAPDETLLSIGGRVLTNEATPQPILGARVQIDALEPVYTGEDGRFTITTIASGPHTLRATATGFQAGQKAITVPGPPNMYEIRLDS